MTTELPAIEDQTHLDEPCKDDLDPANVRIRAGFIRGLALRDHLDETDRIFLKRASRSLLLFAAMLDGLGRAERVEACGYKS